VAEVEVDLETGFVDVARIWVAHDCGLALNPVLVQGQMEGSAYMGFAEAIMEQQIFKDATQGRAGLHDGPSLLDYRIPTSLDITLVVSQCGPCGDWAIAAADRVWNTQLLGDFDAGRYSVEIGLPEDYVGTVLLEIDQSLP
jgi:xanthine dehydrogenase molybdopterin-binding subunit B